jgi:glycosyltransferase involved in cell wall biosynthesis
MRNLRILYVVSHWPGAPPYGGQQRILHIGRLLQKVGDVRLVLVNVDPDGERWRRQTEAEFKIAHVVGVRPIGAHGVLGRLRHEFDPSYLRTFPIAAHPVDREVILRLLDQHDVAWIHLIKVADLLGIDRWPNTVIDIDDIPSRLYRSFAMARVNPMRRLLDYRMSVIWRRRERRLSDRFSRLLVSSDDDRTYLGSEKVRVLPNGFERPPSLRRCVVHPRRIGFIGTFRWEPNVEGVQWFCRAVWPLIKRQLPDVRLRLVGDRTELGNKWGEGVDALGRAEDAASEISTWSAMIVPVRIGGGTRIKVLEGFARHCPVVATRLGAFGYDLRDGEELFLADAPKIFASRCIELIRSPEVAAAMADRAHVRFLKFWTWESYAEIVQTAVNDVAKIKST